MKKLKEFWKSVELIWEPEITDDVGFGFLAVKEQYEAWIAVLVWRFSLRFGIKG